MFDLDDLFPPFVFSPVKSPSARESAFNPFDLGAASPLSAPSALIPTISPLSRSSVIAFRDVLSDFEQAEKNTIPEPRAPPLLNRPQRRRSLVMKSFVSLEATEITVRQLRPTNTKVSSLITSYSIFISIVSEMLTSVNNPLESEKVWAHCQNATSGREGLFRCATAAKLRIAGSFAFAKLKSFASVRTSHQTTRRAHRDPHGSADQPTNQSTSRANSQCLKAKCQRAMIRFHISREIRNWQSGRVSRVNRNSSQIGICVKSGGIAGAVGEMQLFGSRESDQIVRRISMAMPSAGVPERFI
jgi:hypothetical protein